MRSGWSRTVHVEVVVRSAERSSIRPRIARERADPLVVSGVATDQFQIGGAERLPGQGLTLLGASWMPSSNSANMVCLEQSRAQAFPGAGPARPAVRGCCEPRLSARWTSRFSFSVEAISATKMA